MGSLNLGKIGLSYKDRFIQGRFFTPERINQVEFQRDYNISPTTIGEDESLREVRLSLLPVQQVNLLSSAGFLRKGNNFKSNRFNNILKIANSDDYNLDYNLDYVETENLNAKTNWLRQEGNGFFIFWKLKPGLEFLAEDKESKVPDKDSLTLGSLKYLEVNPYLQIVNLNGLKIGAKYSLRDDYLL